MAFDKRIYRPGERPHYVFDQKKGDKAQQRYFYLKLGTIEDIDYVRYRFIMSWLHGQGPRDIPITFPYIGPSGMIGAMPERGSLGIFAFFDEGGGKGSPLCVGYLPAGLGTAISHNQIKVKPDVVSTDDVNVIRHQFREMKEGDISIASSKGSGLYLNNKIELLDRMGDSFYIRDGDQSIISTSLNNFVFADGVAMSCGPAMRNDMIIYDSDGNKIPFILAAAYPMENGKENVYIVPYGDKIQYNTQYFCEYRLDVDEISDGLLNFNTINSENPISTSNPVITMAMGNYIGADKKNAETYGMVLRPILFQNINDKNGQFYLQRCMQNNGTDEPGVLGLAYALHCLKSGSFIGIDKEGHYYMNLSASSSNPIGSGRSMSILAKGNLKEIWGIAAKDNNSWDLTAKGGIRWDVGAHNNTRQGRSIDISTDKSIYLEMGGNDNDGFAKQEIINGNSNEYVAGKATSIINESEITISGFKKETIRGSTQESVLGDKTISVSGVWTDIALTEKQCKFAKRKTTITLGDDELEVLAGNIKETIKTFGKRTTTVTTGSIEETIIAGNRSTKIKAGNYTVSVTAGVIKIETLLGSISLKGTNVTIDGKLLTTIKSPLVRIGNGALIGGVVSGLPGKPNHFDYLTGLPLRGSFKVSVG